MSAPRLHEPDKHRTLEEYAAVAHLTAAVDAFRAAAASALPALKGRVIWMLNSTGAGGGVAELLSAQVALLRQAGLDVRWLVLQSEDPHFFAFTKRLHNLIHGAVLPPPDANDRAVYDAVSRDNADALAQIIAPNDILIVHDPQPLGAGALLAERLTGLRTVWRCHIGLDQETEATRAAWSFLEPYTRSYRQTVFSMAEYVPRFLRQRSAIIPPAIDPLSYKNRDLSLHKLVGILCDAALVTPHWPMLEPRFTACACRLRADGSFGPAINDEDFGLLGRPIVTQVSRWDALKGFAPLLAAFAALKQSRHDRTYSSPRHARRVETARLVLAGPEVGAIADDPEASAVLQALIAQYLALPPEVQDDIAIVTLPMGSVKQNALMVNALQRSSDVVVQNSLREGFGLTVAEAMWKRSAVLGSARACGIRAQVTDGVDGRLVEDPENPAALAALLHEMLGESDRLEVWGRNGQRRVHEDFLVFTELQRWLRLLTEPIV